MPSRLSHPRSGQGRFATTRWSLVLAAGGSAADKSRAALVALCEAYWYPLYAYARRRGHVAEEAQDLTQEFFAQLVEKRIVRSADRQRGKFRSFLLASLNHFLAKEWRPQGAKKRGGGQTLLSLDFASGESRLAVEPAHDLTPEKIFERRWAMTLLERALSRLCDEYQAAGKLALFDRLKGLLAGAGQTPYRQLAEELKMSEAAVKVAVHRLRRRCRTILRSEIAQTVTSPDEVDEELRDLFQAVEM
jgi:RNA polymerase sigma-70 factor (ECF subfamily)